MPLATGDVDRQAKIAYLEGSMKRHELWALYHLARIHSGAAVRGNVLGADEKPFSDSEKIDLAFMSVRSHLEMFQECLDNRDSLIRGED